MTFPSLRPARATSAAGEGASASWRVAEGALALLALAAGVYILLSTVRMIVECWTAVPFWDQWDNLILALDELYWHTTRLDLPHWLFHQHNEHRIAVPRLIFAIDRFLFATTNRFNFFCSIAIQFGLALLMISIAIRRPGQRVVEKLWIAGVVLALLFSAMQWENLLWGFQVQFLGVNLAALATFATLGVGRPSAVRLTVVIGIESIAVYTLSSGVLVPALAIPLALWRGWPRRYVVILIVAAVALLLSYLYGYQTPVFSEDPMRAIWQVREVATYVLDEIGNPFGLTFAEAHFGDPLAWARLFGTIGVVAVAAFTVDMLRRREYSGPVPILIAAALFGLGMMLLTALGRMKFGLALSSRYSSLVLMFWASLIVIATLRLGLHSPRLRVPAMVVILPFLLGLAHYQPSFAAYGRTWTLPRLEATTALLANVDDPEALNGVYPGPTVPRDRAPLLRERHLSIFSEEWSGWLGTPLADHTHFSDPARCRGGIDQVTAVGMSDPKGWRASGWARDGERRAIPERVVIADADGVVVGYAFTGFPKAGGADGGGWRGHFAMAPEVSIKAYALLGDEHMACPLARWPVSP